MRDIDNILVNDGYWREYEYEYDEEYEGEWDRLCREADDEYDSRFDFCRDYYIWSKHEDGYLF